MGLFPNGFQTDRIAARPGIHHLPVGYHYPWNHVHKPTNDVGEKLKNPHFGKNGFQAIVDVQHFQPSEVTVKTMNHTVIIEAKHDDKEDSHGLVQRHFIRKYELPPDYDMSTVNSSLSSDGIITVVAHQPLSKAGSEIIVPLTLTDSPVLSYNKKSENEIDKSEA